MIKLIAAFLMVIDHAGYIFFSENIAFRLIGRISMPLFAYCIARGYEFSRKHGTVKKYLKNLVLFSVVAQLPYSKMQSGLNIGVTWLFSLLLLIILGTCDKKPARDFLACVAVSTAAFCINIDYGLYGAVMPLVMYYFMIKKYEPFKVMEYMVILWAFYVLVQNGSLIQIVSCAAIPVLMAAIPIDNRIRLPKWFFYMFYPAHIAVLLLVHTIVKI